MAYQHWFQILFLLIIKLYECAADSDTICEIKFINDNEVNFICNTLSDVSSFNITSIPSSIEHITHLKINCENNQINNDKHLLVYENLSQFFIYFNRLKEIIIINCKISKWSSNSLYSLNDLRNFTLNSFNYDKFTLEIEPFSFLHIKQLEKLDVSYNNIKNLPELLFCPLKNLINLNISHNYLHDLKDFYFNPENDNFTKTNRHADSRYICNLNIQYLDLSFNYFPNFPSKSLSSLRRLHNLLLNNNQLKLISDNALFGLQTLRKIDLSVNQLVALPSTLFQDSLDVREIYLQNNSLVTLTDGLFAKLEQLLILDVSFNQLTSKSIDSLTFSGLIRLVLLNLSHNKLTSLETYYFKDLYTLQILNLENNLLENVKADTFSPMNNLHTLILSYNKLKKIDSNTFHGLYAMVLLSLDNNLLHTIHKDALRNCSVLQDLNLNGNTLNQLPSALHNMRLLRTLDLGENLIEQLDNPSFVGMTNLNGLRLIGNDIKFISSKALSELPNLQILNLSHNKIKRIEQNAFDLNKNLQAIRLDCNLLTNISGLFTNMPSLIWLNVSDNQINKFDYTYIPIGLQWLDLHKNKIKEITNINWKILSNKLKLQTLDLSFNLISKLTLNSLPNYIELLLLNDNQISTIEINTFMDKINLTRVDLYANEIINMDINSLRLNPISLDKRIPEFYIGGNPFQCDCTMEWLQRINTLTHLRIYPKIMDLENIYCKLPYNKEINYITLNEADSSHFVCQYETHCFALCHCCDFDACDCKMACPNNCTCYHDQSWSAANIVDCSATGYTLIPTNIPMDATKVYLDGNNLNNLTSYSFIGRKNLMTLYLNNSEIEIINNHTFSGLKRLKTLHLQNNYLKYLKGSEFNCLNELAELYLQNNHLEFISNNTFSELKSLQVIQLDNNRLHLYPVWLLSTNPYLVRITLSTNNWSCHCQYLREYRQWLRINIAKVTDYNLITCVLRFSNDNSQDKQLGPHLSDFNSSSCTSYLSGVGYLDSDYNLVYSRNYIVICVIIILSLFVIIISIVFTIAYNRHKLNAWLHNCCCCCCKSKKEKDHNNEVNTDICVEKILVKRYDAYITYNIKDMGFVHEILVPRLEANYKLKLHHNSLVSNNTVTSTDIIIESIESSHRTIMILSTSFLLNEWNRYDYKSAFREGVHRELKYSRNHDKNKKLIIIIFGDLPAREVDPDLRIYLNKTAICIKWGDNRFWEKLRNALPNVMDSCKTQLLNNRANGDTLKGSLYYCSQQRDESGSSAVIQQRATTLKTHHHHHHEQNPHQNNHYPGLDFESPHSTYVATVRSVPRSSSKRHHVNQRGSVWA